MGEPRKTRRCCASCEWVWLASGKDCECPLCGFGSYLASYVHGRKAVRYAKTQEPWREKQLAALGGLLSRFARESLITQCKRPQAPLTVRNLLQGLCSLSAKWGATDTEHLGAFLDQPVCLEAGSDPKPGTVAKADQVTYSAEFGVLLSP